MAFLLLLVGLTRVVGRYGVDLEGFERFLGALRLRDPSLRLVIIDEIGKRECLSGRFRNLVTLLLDAPSPVIATIALRAGGFIEEVKHRGDVRLYELTERNRDSLLPDVAGGIAEAHYGGVPRWIAGKAWELLDQDLKEVTLRFREKYVIRHA